MMSRRKSGFALPTVLIASVIMLTVLLAAVSATASITVSLNAQYYGQLEQSASDAGTAYAKGCLAQNEGVPLWSDTNPLKPNTDCAGVQLAGFTCPAGSVDTRCFVTLNGNVASSFSVGMPDVDSNGKAININSVGSVSLRKTSDGSTWKEYTQASSTKYSSMTVSVLVVGGGGGGGGIIGGGGGGGGVQYDPDFAVNSGSYKVTVGSGGSGGVGWNNYPQRGDQGANSSLIFNEVDQYGYSVNYPGKSCYSLKLDGINIDGSYWIDSDGSGPNAPFQVYCDMTYDGGGWTMLMKATRGTTFNYNASYWTTNNTLNPSDLTRNDADAKYRSFNELQLTDVMARWPDASDMRWLHNNIWSSRTALSGFNEYRNWGNHNVSPYWNTNFSSQVVQTTSIPGPSAWGTKLGDLGGSANGGARWGYRFNENGPGDYNSDDVGGGIGIRNPSYLYSAGDWYNCCGTAGMNRSARVELYGRNKSDTADVVSSLIAFGGGGGSAHGGVDVRGPTTGGSGGGGAAAGPTGAAGITGQGYAGGNGNGDDGGGGGGGGMAGVNLGAGGDGVLSSISGSAMYYGGGGGGGARYGVGTADAGGKGGGGAGTNSDTKAGDGIANTGGGGGGAGYQVGTTSLVGGNGGSGIVIISYPTGSISATGGTVTTVGKNTVHKFTSSGLFYVEPIVARVKVLVVAGGGSGGGSSGTSIASGGGGGGGVVYSNSYGVGVGIYPITVGAGGAGVSGFNAGNNGQNSSFGNLVAYGGGYGGTWNVAASNGGSGGGAGENGQSLNGGVTVAAGQGNMGGNDSGYDSGVPSAGGGGGGAGVNGSNTADMSRGGNGGAGLEYAISGVAAFYGGGGGGAGVVTAGSGGNGGGGGGRAVTTGTGTAGTANTGGGGGGSLTNANEAAQPGGNGGSGIVIISYPTGFLNATGGTITSSGGYTIHTFKTSGTFVVGSSVQVYAWGAGGAGGTAGGWTYGAAGGAGGAAQGTMSVTTGTNYSIVVGGGGKVNSYNGGSINCAVGGGGCASWNNSDNRYGGGGGGYSGIFASSVISQANALLIAGGGGGGGSSRAGTGNAGGAGGGATGENGYSPYDGKAAYGGRGGTQSAAGADASCDSINTTGGQGALQGGRSKTNSYGGAGGGGYWGGSGGGYSESNTMGGGGGGSSYYNSQLVGSPLLSSGTGTTAGNSSSTYRGSYGNAGAVATNGMSGVVIITYPTGSLNAVGGTISTSDGYTIHTFTSSGMFLVQPAKTLNVLVVAGGGGGGGFGGGGGGGGVVYNASYPVTPKTYSVSVGGGGSGAAYGTTAGGVGGNSVFDTITAYGGGGGGTRICGSPCYGNPGGGGGSSGGGSPADGTTVGMPGASIPGQGNRGGVGANWGWGGAGGGGAGSVAASASGNNGSNGGAGLAYSISGNVVYYGGGGGGCAHETGTPGTGGTGGGGNGNKNTTGGNGYPGTANTGGGGGGGGAGSYTGGAGGSGIVIVSYPTGSITASGGIVTTSGGYTIHTYLSGSGSFTVSAVSGATLGGKELNSYSALLNDASLVAYYRLEANGNDSKSTNNGTVTNVAYGYANGRFGQGGLFDGTTSKIIIPHTAALLPSNITVMGWFRQYGQVQKDWGTGWNLYLDNPTNKAVFSITDQINNKKAVSTTSVIDGNWHFIVGTFDGTYVKIYVDGNMEQSVNISGTVMSGTAPVYIGANNYGGYSAGSIDDVAIFNRALTATEISDFYNN